MRVTDNRYAGELEKFDLAIRMISHEARTGTIRACTGFTEDRIRKLHATYFRSAGGATVRRRRGKSPRQISRFISTATRQTEATVLACLYGFSGAIRFDRRGQPLVQRTRDRVAVGRQVCQAYEAYCALYPPPLLSFELAWNLFHALAVSRELCFAWCDSCAAPYVKDTYALNYRRCPLCELKDSGRRRLFQDEA